MTSFGQVSGWLGSQGPVYHKARSKLLCTDVISPGGWIDVIHSLSLSLNLAFIVLL